MKLERKEVEDILAILGDIPAKYSLNLIMFFNRKIAAQKEERKADEADPE